MSRAHNSIRFGFRRFVWRTMGFFISYRMYSVKYKISVFGLDVFCVYTGKVYVFYDFFEYTCPFFKLLSINK